MRADGSLSKSFFEFLSPVTSSSAVGFVIVTTRSRDSSLTFPTVVISKGSCAAAVSLKKNAKSALEIHARTSRREAANVTAEPDEWTAAAASPCPIQDSSQRGATVCTRAPLVSFCTLDCAPRCIGGAAFHRWSCRCGSRSDQLFRAVLPRASRQAHPRKRG